MAKIVTVTKTDHPNCVTVSYESNGKHTFKNYYENVPYTVVRFIVNAKHKEEIFDGFVQYYN